MTICEKAALEAYRQNDQRERQAEIRLHLWSAQLAHLDRETLRVVYRRLSERACPHCKERLSLLRDLLGPELRMVG